MELNQKPLGDFVANTSESIDNFDLTDSEEIWLVQFPISRVPELEGIELKVELGKDGIFGGLKDSSGEEMDLVSFASQDAGATVIIPSEESTMAGNIARRVSIVRHPEPKELLETMKAKTRQKLVGAVTDSSGKYSTLTNQSSRHRSGQSVRHSASTRSSKPKSLFSGFTETPKSSKRKHSESSSGKHLSSTSNVSGSSERSGKSKKKKMKKEE